MELVEVQFKAQRKELFVNTRSLYLHTGNYCVVQADRGEDMGLIVSISRISDKDIDSDVKEILRHATDRDIEQMEEMREKEQEALRVCQEKAADHDLEIKLVDVEYQFDGNKITFYFTADGRIDFRELVKDLAGVFRTRIDLRQIGVRDEARRFDGMGMCGRRLCCSTWLKDFEPVTLKMAKDQSLPLTPSKISGACGRLMCCLAYELGDYKALSRDIPKTGSKVRCFGAQHRLEKIDIFSESVVVSDEDGNTLSVPIEEFKKELARGAEGEGGEGRGEGAPNAREAGKQEGGPGDRREGKARGGEGRGGGEAGPEDDRRRRGGRRGGRRRKNRK